VHCLQPLPSPTAASSRLSRQVRRQDPDPISVQGPGAAVQAPSAASSRPSRQVRRQERDRVTVLSPGAAFKRQVCHGKY